ncbi:hypothetical protein SG34_016820 [Thalassomonas viridans]|uniref:Uncharacterized protein n=1 Tax=Thalassomonas viridans TaxID=137584 RepID=A0AAE9YXK7_9GAMM|nr:hypothetical protein [Thalassomonas viridans]WDE03086.1 hypothetical protein SG34_016820 [Thalassomonas viridans]
MATFNDMPEFHSVKAFVTENIPARRQHLPVTVGIAFNNCFFIGKHLPLTLEGGPAHV